MANLYTNDMARAKAQRAVGEATGRLAYIEYHRFIEMHL